MPLYCMLMLTDHCNFDCNFCAFKRKQSDKVNLTYDEWLRVIDELYDLGIVYICLTGGEITVLPWFEDIYRYLIKKGFYVALKTNASHITESIRNLLQLHPPYRTLITLYGASDATYEAVTGCMGVYQHVLAGIDFFKSLKTKLKVGITVSKDNLLDVPRIVAAMQERGIQTVLATDIFGRPDGLKTRYKEIRLTPGQRVSLFFNKNSDDFSDVLMEGKKLDALLKNWKPHEKIPFDENEDRIGLCVDSACAFTVMADGKVQYCTNYAIDHDIHVSHGVASAWEELKACRKKYFQISEYCHKCEDRKYCSGSCPAMFYIENGASTIPDEYICQFAYLMKVRSQRERRT